MFYLAYGPNASILIKMCESDLWLFSIEMLLEYVHHFMHFATFHVLYLSNILHKLRNA